MQNYCFSAHYGSLRQAGMQDRYIFAFGTKMLLALILYIQQKCNLLMIKLQHNAFGCFSSNMMQGGGRGAKQMRFPRKCETSFVGDAFIHSLLTMQPAIHHFPLNFIICKQFPCLILHRPKCNFTSHTEADVSWTGKHIVPWKWK